MWCYVAEVRYIHSKHKGYNTWIYEFSISIIICCLPTCLTESTLTTNSGDKPNQIIYPRVGGHKLVYHAFSVQSILLSSWVPELTPTVHLKRLTKSKYLPQSWWTQACLPCFFSAKHSPQKLSDRAHPNSSLKKEAYIWTEWTDQSLLTPSLTHSPQ